VLRDPDAGAPEPPGSTDPESEIKGDRDERRQEMARCGCEPWLETGRGSYEGETRKGRGRRRVAASTAGGPAGCACAAAGAGIGRGREADWPRVRVRARARGGGCLYIALSNGRERG
jgi:hypothetical protein